MKYSISIFDNKTKVFCGYFRYIDKKGNLVLTKNKNLCKKFKSQDEVAYFLDKVCQLLYKSNRTAVYDVV